VFIPRMKQGPLFSALILLSVTAHLCAAESPFYVSLTAQLSFAEDSGIVNETAVPPAFETNLRHFVADTANTRCQQQCHVEGGNVTLESMVSHGDYVFDVSLRIYTDDAAMSLKIAAGGVFLPESVFKSWDQQTVVDLSTALLTTSQQTLGVVEGSSTRPVTCGDGVASGAEECDDFNTVSGDGCSADCKLETGWMCKGGFRSADAPNVLGLKFVSDTVNGSTTYTVTTQPESCPVSDLCRQGDLWQPDLWLDKYGEGVDISNLPPRGYYCIDTCAEFPTPTGLLMNTIESDTLATCALKDLDECIFGLAVCDFMSYCVNTEYDPATGRGYDCFCDPKHFPTAENGVACSDSGFEVVLMIAGKEAYDPGETPPPDLAVLDTVRSAFLDALIALGIFKAKMNKTILLDSVHDYPPELVRVMTEDGYAGRGLYQVKVRMSAVLVNVAEFVTSTIFTDLSALEGVLTDSSASSAYKLFTEQRCSNEQARACGADTDCLNGGTCNAGTPAVTLRSLDAGGTSAPFYTSSSGMSVISVSYDNSQTGWHMRLRYTPQADAVAILYLPRLGNPATAEQMSTFFPDEFPCLPFGTGAMQQRRDNTVCCLNTVQRDFTTVEAFGAFVNNSDYPHVQAIQAQRACYQRGAAPTNNTRDLLNGTLDFVDGRFQDMTRTTSTLDSAKTNGYQDVLVFVAYEDVLLGGGIVTRITGGNSLRFFVGMSFLRLTDSPFFSTSVSSQEISSSITNSYIFSTTGTTEFTFVRDVDVDLIEVMNKTSQQTLKFARILVTVPASVTADDVHNLIPLDSIIARVGYTKDTSLAIQTVYPCLNLYTGQPKAEIDLLLQEQAWCAFQDELCKPLGPAPVNVGGMVTFIVPLQGESWAKDAAPALITQKLFLDFVLAVKDANGMRTMTNVETKTELTALAVNTMCTEKKLESSIDDMFKIDLHLGLTNSSSLINTSLESAYDVTRLPGPVHLSRDVSTTAGNVLTMVLLGRDDVFSREYSRDYSLEIEDLLTVYFLSTEKKAQVDALVAAGLAVKQEVVPGSPSEINLRPTEQLLSICPMQAVRGALGCITRFEVKSRTLDRRTNSIVSIAPENEDDYSTKMQDAAFWTQMILGDTEFGSNVGMRHADAMNTEFNFNSRYRKAYMISPVVPWRQSELRAEGFESEIGLAQYSISFAMLAFDQVRPSLSCMPPLHNV